MSEWNCELFDQDISTMDYRELSDWIIACRSYLVEDTFNSREGYLEILELFFLEWQEHYKQNEKIYKSEKYKKALLFCSLRDRLKFKINFRNGFENFDYNTYQNIWSNSIFAKPVEQEILAISKKYYDTVAKIFKEENRLNYKNILHNDLISNQAFSEIETTFRAFKGSKQVRTASYIELIELMKTDSEIQVESQQRTVKTNYNIALEHYGVAKSIYNDFVNEFKCQKSFDKKMFVNLSFALALPYSFCEKLLKYNGFTLESVNRIFEETCATAFKLGCSRKMVIDILEKKNHENRTYAEKQKSKTKNKKLQYAEIPNLTKNKKQDEPN